MSARGEQGMTLIEVVVAAFCLALILGAAALLFATGNSSALQSNRQSALISVADQAIETIRQQLKTSAGGFSSLAMSSAPAAGSSTTLAGSSTVDTDPNDFVSPATGCGASNEGYLIESNWDDTSEGVLPSVSAWSGCASGAEPLIISTGSGIVTPKQTVTVGQSTATVYAYVTDTNIGCSSTILGSCYTTGGTTVTPLGDARRVVVAVVLANGGTHNTGAGSRLDIGQNSPVYVSAIFTNPVPSNQSNGSVGVTLGTSIG